jgi:hypothetical protein
MVRIANNGAFADEQAIYKFMSSLFLFSYLSIFLYMKPYFFCNASLLPI